ISSITDLFLNTGDGGVHPCTNLRYAQDFLQNDKNLQFIELAHSYYYVNYVDSSFKLSRLKSDWNTYFTNLKALFICEDHWNRENLSSLIHLNNMALVAASANHSNNSSGN